MASDEERGRKLERWRASGAPVQSTRGHPFPPRIPWHFHERAWSVYAAAGHGDQSAVRLAERGGFGVLEVVACLALGTYPADYGKITVEHVAAVRAEIEEWTSGNDALRGRAEKAEAERDALDKQLQAVCCEVDSALAEVVATQIAPLLARLDAVRALVVKLRDSAMQYEDDGYSGIANDMREHADEVETALGGEP